MEWRGWEWKLSWTAIALLFVATEYAVLSQQVFWIIMGMWALCLALFPAVLRRDIRQVPPFEVLLLICVPFLIFLFDLFIDPSRDVWYGSSLRWGEIMATFLVGFMTVLNLHVYTTLDLDRRFAVVFTVILTTALGTFFAIGEYVSGALLSISTIGSNTELMQDLISSFFGGILMGVILDLYLKRKRFERFERFALGGEVRR